MSRSDRPQFGRALLGFALFALSIFSARAERITIDWPTPSTAFAAGKSIDAFIQHAGSGEAESGCFGCVRTSGNQFHEGIDIKPINRNRQGEATDSIFAAMDGVVRHLSSNPGESSYGRYVVLEHPDVTPAVYTLYAHLAKIAPDLQRGERVTRGQILGTMGRSASGYAIPRERAHLHFEIGLWITRNFQSWYNGRKFGSSNEHGLYNGMNLMGIDPLDFFRAHRAGRVDNFQEYFAQMAPAVRVRIATPRTPDFVQRYPSLVTKEMPMLVAGWEVAFNWTGLPISWTPLSSSDVAGLPLGRPVVVHADAAMARAHRCRDLVISRRGKWAVAKDLETVLQQLFGLK